MRLTSLLFLPFALSCAAPLATTAVAVGAATYEREHGRCVAACTPGNQCNAATGFCEPIPCAKGCPRASPACKGSARRAASPRARSPWRSPPTAPTHPKELLRDFQDRGGRRRLGWRHAGSADGRGASRRGSKRRCSSSTWSRRRRPPRQPARRRASSRPTEAQPRSPAEMKKALQRPALALDTAVTVGPVAETLADIGAAQKADLSWWAAAGAGPWPACSSAASPTGSATSATVRCSSSTARRRLESNTGERHDPARSRRPPSLQEAHRSPPSAFAFGARARATGAGRARGRAP